MKTITATESITTAGHEFTVSALEANGIESMAISIAPEAERPEAGVVRQYDIRAITHLSIGAWAGNAYSDGPGVFIITNQESEHAGIQYAQTICFKISANMLMDPGYTQPGFSGAISSSRAIRMRCDQNPGPTPFMLCASTEADHLGGAFIRMAATDGRWLGVPLLAAMVPISTLEGPMPVVDFVHSRHQGNIDIELSDGRFVVVSRNEWPNSGLLPTLVGEGFPGYRAPGDINGDGVVDAGDLGALLGNWGGSGAGDINGDGVVDAADLGALLDAMGRADA